MMAVLYFIRSPLVTMQEAFRRCRCLVSKNRFPSCSRIFTKVRPNFQLTDIGLHTCRMSLERIKSGCRTFHPQVVSGWCPLTVVTNPNGGRMERNCFTSETTQ